MRLKKLHKLAIYFAALINIHSYISAHTPGMSFKKLDTDELSSKGSAMFFVVPTITGNFSVCEGDSGLVYTTESGKINYSWSVTGGTITSGQYTNSVTVKWNTAGNQEISINYTGAIHPATQSVFVKICIIPEIIITQSDDSTQTSEAGTTDDFEVVLSKQPSSDVVINIDSLDITEGSLDKTQLTFTNANWDIPQIVTVTGQDDDLTDGDINYSITLAVDDDNSDNLYDGLSKLVNITNTDNDTAKILVSYTNGSNQTSESGTTDSIYIKLNSEPVSDVVIDITGLDNSEGSLDIDSLIFTPANWNIPQLVKITGVDDPLIDGDITYALNFVVVDARSDDDYDGLSVTANVTNMDDDVAGISVSLSDGNNLTSETGTSDTIAIVLNSQPATDVVINITGVDASEGSLDKTQITFTDTNWDTPQIIIVTGVDDDLIDGDITYSLNVTVDDLNSDDDYDGISQTVDVTNLDDDVAGISVTLSDGSNLTSETGTSDTIVIVLNSKPTTGVVIDITGVDSSEGSLDKTQITFTDTNWDTPQIIIVTGVDDDLIDGDITYTLNVTVDDANSDDDYDGISQTVDVTNLDDDVAGISVTLSDGSNLTSETGTSDTIVIVLNSRPTTDVVIDITGVDASEGSLDKTQITFTDTNWDIPQFIIVTGVDDDLIDGDITYTLNVTVDDANSDDNYDGISQTVDVTNLDDDVADISVYLSDGSNLTYENGISDTIVIVLNSQPIKNVVIDITGLDTSEGNLDKTQIIFTSADWDTPQNVIVTGVDDDIIDGDITYTLNLTVDDASSDDDYDGLSKTVDVTNIDNDKVGILVSLSDGNNHTSESGRSDTIIVVLKEQPATDVVIDITGIDASEGSLDKTQLTFTNTNWDTPQTVIVTGVDDDIIDGDITYSLDFSVDDANSDDKYDGLSKTVDVTNADDDIPGFTITLTDGNNITSETGTSDEFNVVLNSQPIDKVVIDLSGVDATEGSLDKVRLVFTNSNWDIPQTVTVTGRDDDILDGDITYTISLTVNNVGSDDAYDGLFKTTEVTNIDDEDNRAPLINDEAVTIFQGDTATGNLLENDSDPDGDNLIINTTPVVDASEGTVVINEDGTFSYIPDDATFTGTDYFTYEVCDDGTPQQCATGTVTITINIKDNEEEEIIIPEGFSPNNDGSNDNFVIPGIEQYNHVSIIIFNRWGNIVYESDYYANDWDGKSNTKMSKGKDLPIGTYFYHLIINDTNRRFTGYVYLNR